MVQAQIGNGSNVGIFALLLGFVVGLFVFFSDIVDVRLVPLAVGVDHRGSVATTRIALMLHVALFLAVTAHNVGIAGAVVLGRVGIGSGRACGGRVVVAERLLTANSCNLVDFLIGELVPEDGVGLTWLHGGFDRSDFL